MAPQAESFSVKGTMSVQFNDRFARRERVQSRLFPVRIRSRGVGRRGGLFRDGRSPVAIVY